MQHDEARIKKARGDSARDGKVRFVGFPYGYDGSMPGANRLKVVACKPENAAETLTRLENAAARYNWERIDPKE